MLINGQVRSYALFFLLPENKKIINTHKSVSLLYNTLSTFALMEEKTESLFLKQTKYTNPKSTCYFFFKIFFFLYFYFIYFLFRWSVMFVRKYFYTWQYKIIYTATRSPYLMNFLTNFNEV